MVKIITCADKCEQFLAEGVTEVIVHDVYKVMTWSFFGVACDVR